MGDTVKIPVIIIDDESLIRKLIIKSVDWMGLGFDIVAEAQNSEEALELIAKYRPRLAMVDINIPYINGIELAKQLRSTHPDLAIIFLTGYNDFSYAQQAIRLNVANYLLKPINTGELIQALKDVRTDIFTKARYKGRDLLHETNHLSHQLSKKDFLKKLLHESETLQLSDLENGFKQYEMDGLLEYQQVVFVVELGKNVHPTLEEINDVVEPLLNNLPEEMSVELTQDALAKYVMLISFPQGAQEKHEKTISLLAISVRHHISVAFGHSCSVGVGSIVHTIYSLTTSYQGALQALEERYYTNRETVFHYLTTKASPVGTPMGSEASFDSKALLILLRGGGESEVLALIRKVIKDMQTQRIQRQLCTMQVFNFVTTIEKFLSEQSFSLSLVLGEGCDIAHEVQELENLGQVRDWLEWLAIRVFDLVADNASTKTQMLVMRAKRYMESHYADGDLGLDRISSHVEVTPSYISGVYKKVLGISIVRYLTDYRIKKAKWYMDCDPLMSVSEVAEAVGYSDAFYFSKVFTKQEGLPPSAYLKRKRIL